MMRKCSNCHEKYVKENYIYCPICGCKLEICSIMITKKESKRNELISALITCIDLFGCKSDQGKIINKSFKKDTKISGGKISLMIDISNLPSQEIITALDKLQDFSNTLMFKEIPDTIAKK